MKFTSTILAVVLSLLSQTSFAQLSNGGLFANFGVDADTRSNYMKYGLVTGSVASDDWFSPLLPNSIIDTSSAAFYRSLLQTGINASFTQRMSVPLYSKIKGKLWLDAAYARDYTAAAASKDSTTFTGADKNGDTTGSAYFDVELYKNSFSYNQTTGVFIVICNPLGQVLQKRSVQLYKGCNSVNLPFSNGQMAYTQKMVR